jgi:hypothetical protein
MTSEAPLTRTMNLLPLWSRCVGWLLLAGVGIFAARAIYESTILTCEKGPQMVGFALVHGAHPFFFAGLLCAPFALLWLLSAIVFGFIKRMRFSPSEWTLLGSFIVCFVLLGLPYPVWIHVDILACGPGNSGGEFLREAAYHGDLALVKHLLDKGVRVDPAGGSPLSSAVFGGRTEVVMFLLARGANINSQTNSAAETPLMVAASTGNVSMIRLLLTNGAEPCRIDSDGSDAQQTARKHHQQEAAEYLSSHSHCPVLPSPAKSCTPETASTCVEVH